MVHNTVLAQHPHSWDGGEGRRDQLGSQHISRHHGAEIDEQQHPEGPSSSRHRDGADRD